MKSNTIGKLDKRLTPAFIIRCKKVIEKAQEPSYEDINYKIITTIKGETYKIARHETK